MMELDWRLVYHELEFHVSYIPTRSLDGYPGRCKWLTTLFAGLAQRSAGSASELQTL